MFGEWRGWGARMYVLMGERGEGEVKRGLHEPRLRAGNLGLKRARSNDIQLSSSNRRGVPLNKKKPCRKYGFQT